MKVWIYKGAKKPGAYLYLASADDFSGVPAGLLQLFGKPQLVMQIELDAARKLANADAGAVLQILREQQYYLQMPPGESVNPTRVD